MSDPPTPLSARRPDPDEGRRFQQDVAWNMVGYALMGVCGILLNVLIGIFYDPATLGVFNQVFAIYILFSQFAALGIHYSTLKHVAEAGADARASSHVIAGTLIPTFILSLASTVVMLACREWIGQLLSEEVARGIAWASVGLFFFGINKVLLGAINGLNWMRAFAVLQALRPVLIVAGVMVMSAGGAPAESLPAAMSAAEAVLFAVCLGLLVVRGYLKGPFHDLLGWGLTHVNFGIRGFASGILVELNTRVDVLLLGYFSDNRTVGVYSFAAILAEGVYQILVVLRNVYSPLVVARRRERDEQALGRLIRRGKIGTYLATAVVGGAAILLYPVAIGLVGASANYARGWPVFATLMTGIVLIAGYVPFSNVLLLAGRPGMHTLLMLLVTVVNVAGNMLLIPFWGAQGAAVATAFSFVFLAGMLIVMARRTVGIRL